VDYLFRDAIVFLLLPRTALIAATRATATTIATTATTIATTATTIATALLSLLTHGLLGWYGCRLCRSHFGGRGYCGLSRCLSGCGCLGILLFFVCHDVRLSGCG
jgi:hypothetical protein